MQGEFRNRLTAIKTAREVLEQPDLKTVWENQPPEAFTERVGDLDIMIAAVEKAQKDQEAGTSGPTQDKELEEKELEDVAMMYGNAVVLYDRQYRGEVDVSGLEITETEWRKMAGLSLLGRSQKVIDAMTTILAGAHAADATALGITTANLASLTKERTDYDEIINAPSAAIAIRAALSKGFRPAFRLLDGKMGELDMLIVQFGGTTAGKGMIAAWKAGRVIKGVGQGTPAKSAAKKTTTPPVTPPGS